MASDQESLLLGCGSTFTEDSLLLSDYLHRQAERAGDRLFNDKNSLLFLRSKLFSSQFLQEEGEKDLDRCRYQEIESMAAGLIAAQKENSESFSRKECSSNVISELQQQKGDSLLSQRSVASSTSCIESSSGYTKNGSLQSDLFCCEAKEEISMSSCATEDVKVIADESPTTKYDTEALDLLVLVAMQAIDHNARLDAAAVNASSGALIAGEIRASPAHRDSFTPILRKRVVRRAKSAFQKPDFSDGKFKFCESLRKEIGCCSKDRQIAPPRHGARVAHAKQKKLQDLSLSSADASEKAAIIKHLKGNFIAKNVSEDLPQIAVQTVEDRGEAVNYRKLQISSGRLFDLYDAELPESTQNEARQRKYSAFTVVQTDNQLRAEVSKDVSKWDASLEKVTEANSTVMPADHAKQMNSFLRLKILPVKQPSEDLVSQHNGSKIKNSNSPAEEGRMLTRNRSVRQRTEQEKLCSSITGLSSFGRQTVTQKETQAMSSTGPVMRTKRGRSQVLPTKFSDSILQPWKSSRRKIKILDA